MRSARFQIIALTVAAIFLPSSANALELDTNLEVFTDTTFSTPDPGFTIDGDGNATGPLSPGQGIRVTIDIANLDPDVPTVDAIFTSIVIDNAQVTFLGGSAVVEVLLGGPVFAPTSLTRLAQPATKGNSPNIQNPPSTEQWIQSTAYAAQGGTDGQGPDIEAVTMFFEVASGVGAGDEIIFDLALTQGDALNSPDLGDLAAVSILEDAIINVPEPGTVALALASLGTVAFVVRLRRGGEA